MFQRLTFFFLLFLTLIPCQASWKDLIESYSPLMDPSVHKLLSTQFQAYEHRQLPKIADDSVKRIPIEESFDPLIDVTQENQPRLKMLPTPTVPFFSPDHNSGLPSAPKLRKKVYEKLVTMLTCLDQLSPHFGFIPGQISIRVFEGLRDLSTQQHLFEKKMAEIKDANPSWEEEGIFSEAAKWVSPTKDNIPVHSTGAAVDMRLYNEAAHVFLDMGPFGVIWGENKVAPTFSEALSKTQIKNRLLLLIAAAQAGLVNYSYEFWHFSSGDRYAAFWEMGSSSRTALYGPVSQ